MSVDSIEVEPEEIAINVKIISGISYSFAGIAFLAAMVFLILGFVLSCSPNMIKNYNALSDDEKGSFKIPGIASIVFGIILGVFAVLYYLAGEGLGKTKKWSKNLLITLLAITLIFAFVMIFINAIIGVLIVLVSISILGYVLFSHNFKQNFIEDVS